MIKKYYYSTLNEKLYETKTEAQEAEDKYVEEYFDELSKKAEIKRRKLKHVTDADFGVFVKF